MKTITREQYLKVKSALESGVSKETVASLSGLSVATVSRIKNGTHVFDSDGSQDNATSEEILRGIAALRESQEQMCECLSNIEGMLAKLNECLERINTTGLRCRAQIEGVRQDFSDLTGWKPDTTKDKA